MSQRYTFQNLCIICPQLSDLYHRALITNPVQEGMIDWYKWKSLKKELCTLVGWEAEQSPTDLRNSIAYEIAYNKIFLAFSSRE